MTMVSSGPIYLGGAIEQSAGSTNIAAYSFPVATQTITTGSGKSATTTTYYGFLGGTISPSAAIDVGSGTITEIHWTAAGYLVLGISGASSNSGWTSMYLNGTVYARTSATYAYTSGVGTWSWLVSAPAPSDVPASVVPKMSPFPITYSTYVDAGLLNPATPYVGFTCNVSFTGVAVGNVSTSINESVALEVGIGATSAIYMNTSSVQTLAGATSPIYFSEFYGKSAPFNYSYTLPSGVADTNFNLSARLTSAGWNGTSPVIANITVNGVLGSTSSTTYAFDTGTGYPAGSTINVTVGSGGYITGAGGGTPGYYSGLYNPAGGGGGAVANDGGNAMHVQVPINLTNNGIIQGGGGAGNGGDNNYAGGGSGFFTGGFFYQVATDGWVFATLNSGSSYSYNPGGGSSNGGAGGGWVYANSGESVANSVNGTGNSSPGEGDGPGGQSAGVFTAGAAIVGRTNCNPVVAAQASTVNGAHYRGTVQ
jgi:hypothetical protein